MMDGRRLSFWDGIFLGAMLNFQGVSSHYIHSSLLDLDLGNCLGNLHKAFASSGDSKRAVLSPIKEWFDHV